MIYYIIYQRYLLVILFGLPSLLFSIRAAVMLEQHMDYVVCLFVVLPFQYFTCVAHGFDC